MNAARTARANREEEAAAEEAAAEEAAAGRSPAPARRPSRGAAGDEEAGEVRATARKLVRRKSASALARRQAPRPDPRQHHGIGPAGQPTAGRHGPAHPSRPWQATSRRPTIAPMTWCQ